MKLENIENLLLCSECENQLRVEVYLEGKPFFSVQPCVHCTNTDTSESESQPVRESVPGNAMKSTFELRIAANAVYLATDERTADHLSALLNGAADKIDELALESEAKILDIVDSCFHAYASSFRTDAKELAQEILGGY